MKKKRFIKEIYEYKAIEKELEKMAGSGWLLSEIRGNAWCFEQCLPQDLMFSISIHGDEDAFDFPDRIGKTSLRALCEEAGWTFAAENMIYQVFYREKNDAAAPIYTDDAVTFSIMKKVVRRNQIPLVFLTLIFLINALRDLSNYHVFRKIYELESARFPWSFLAVISFMTYLLYSEVWLSRNEKNLETGQSLFFFSGRQIVLRNIMFYGAVILYLTMNLLNLAGHVDSLRIIVPSLLVFFLQIAFLRWIIRRFKTVKHSRKTNMLIYAASGVVIWVVSIFMTFLYISWTHLR